VRDSFYEFMLTLMKNYKKFWVKSRLYRKFTNIKKVNKIAR